MKNGAHFACDTLAITLNAIDFLSYTCLSGNDLPKNNAAEIIRVIQIGNQEFEMAFFGNSWWWRVRHDGLKQGLHVDPFVRHLMHGNPILGTGINHGKVQLLVRCIEGKKEIEDLVQYGFRIRVFPVNLVDHDNGLGPGLKSFTQDKTRLCLRTFHRIHDQHDPINHVHDPFDLSPKIRMARSVDNIDVDIPVSKGSILCLDGNAFFPFQVHIVHHALFDDLVGPEQSRLSEQAID